MKKVKQEIDYTEGMITVKEMIEILKISRTKAYELVAREDFPAKKFDFGIRIAKKELNEWIKCA